LTPKGGRVASRYGVEWRRFDDAKKYTIGPINIIFHLQGGAFEITDGIAQRDHAIMMGALGATTIVIRDGELWIGDMCLDKSDPSFSRGLKDLFELRDNDALIIGCADTEDKAFIGGLYASYITLRAHEYFRKLHEISS
ncbi:MAG: hypothetical protein DRN20_04160, partial [Thermoplasmata archaeon]